MIDRRPSADGEHVEIVFAVPTAYGPVSVVGDFNDWDPGALPLRPDGDQQVARTVVPAGRRYQFRYVTPTGVYCNDETADDYLLNEYGGFNCVLDLTRSPHGS